MKRPIVMFVVFAAICLVVLPFWALQAKGGSDAAPSASVPASDQQGLQLFQINCGPNLDQLLGTGTKSADTVKANQQRVLSAVENGIQGRMPKGLLKGAQADQVAQFVADNLQYVGSP
jgi:mono/diheme cytochrome c family protein